MTSFRTICVLSILTLASASPITLGMFNSRDNGACYPQNMPTGVSDFNCPHKYTMDSNGHCSSALSQFPSISGCTGYCEVRLTPFYGREVPFFDGACQAGTTCTVANSQSVTVTNTYTIDVGISISSAEDVSKALTSAFNIGASYSYSTSIGYTTIETFQKALDSSTCGYWTFIPYMFESCGTLTAAQQKDGFSTPSNPDGVPYCDNNSLTDTQNWCNKTPYTDANGHADGKVVFVYTNCQTNAVLPTGQDPAYESPGVSTGPKSSKN